MITTGTLADIETRFDLIILILLIHKTVDVGKILGGITIYRWLGEHNAFVLK